MSMAELCAPVSVFLHDNNVDNELCFNNLSNVLQNRFNGNILF